METRKTRVRFAPSPTGPLHIGGVRTALYNYLFAKHHQGDFILRIEDTDSTRFVEGAEKYIIDALEWCGIKFDEGTHVGGPYAPYKQSERKEIYLKYAEQLLNNGMAYLAFDTTEELEQHRKEAERKGETFIYNASTRDKLKNSISIGNQNTKQIIANGAPWVIRFKFEPNQKIEMNDLIRGKITVDSSTLDDKVLYKSSDGLPTYHLANIVDDYLMQITHVIRGEEWLPSLPLHVMLYKSLGWEHQMPLFAHLPLLLKPDGKGKLSKRDGDKLGFPVFPLLWTDQTNGETSSGYREFGFIPKAFVNFLALLGWNPGTEQELFEMNELIDSFSLDRCSKAGARFDFDKAIWFNHQYIQKLSDDELVKLIEPFLTLNQITYNPDKLIRIVNLIKPRLNFPKDILEQAGFFFIAPANYDPEVIKKRWKIEIPTILEQISIDLNHLDSFTAAQINEHLHSFIETNGYNMGQVMNCLRLCLVGAAKGPELPLIIEILGIEEVKSRIRVAIEKIKV